MIRIDPPPPKRSAQPVIHILPAGERLLRIYDPGELQRTPPLPCLSEPRLP